MTIKKFQEIIAWQKAQELIVEIYKNFRDSRDFAFKDQICRVAISIPNNIAEGFDRSSDADFVRFLYIVKGSCSELQSMLFTALKLNYVNEDTYTKLDNNSDEISKLIRGLIKAIVKK